MKTLYAVHAQSDDEYATGLCYDLSGRNIFYTGHLSKAKQYRDECEQFNNKMYNAVYTVVKIVPLEGE